MFKVSEDDLIDACYRIMELYHRPKPNIDKLQEAVEELKKKYQEQRKKDHGNNSSPAITIVDRSNGSLHNALGGFISRQLPSTGTTTNESDGKHKTDGKTTSTNNNNNNNEKGSISHSRSRSRSRSGEKYGNSKKKDRGRKRTMSRSDDSDYDRRSSKKSR